MLADLLAAAERVLRFAGADRDAYFDDELVQSAVERQLSILGETVNQVSRLDPELAEGLTRYREIVGLRNVLAHQYGEIDQRIIWNIVERHVPVLRDEVRAILDQA